MQSRTRLNHAQMEWKGRACLPFEKPAVEVNPADFKRPRLFAPKVLFANAEMDRLWKYTNDVTESEYVSLISNAIMAVR
jgi:hypothetical protein